MASLNYPHPVMANETRPRKRKPEPSPHHEPYPDRIVRHLTAAADAHEALAAPLPVEGDAGTAEGLLGRYGAADEAGEGTNGRSDA